MGEQILWNYNVIIVSLTTRNHKVINQQRV